MNAEETMTFKTTWRR